MPATPRRVLRSRARGSRTPPNTVNIDRTSRWGNPFLVEDFGLELALDYHRRWLLGEGGHPVPPPTRIRRVPVELLAQLGDLSGRDLACYCLPGQRCHGDLLLALANAQTTDAPASGNTEEITMHVVDLDETFYSGPDPEPCIQCGADGYRHNQWGNQVCDRWPDCELAAHYHVFAIQDWGGTRVEDELTLADARQYADDMARADISPGWSGIWVVPCADPCTVKARYALRELWGAPHWTPAPIAR